MLSVNEKIAALRAEMEKEKLAAYYIPTNDFHGSEYIGDYFKVREYLSGFTGSAGTLIITKNFAGLWTDGRYFIQAEDQLAGTEIVLMKMGEAGVPAVDDFLAETLNPSDSLGYEGALVSADFVENLKKKFKEVQKDIQLVGNSNLIDKIWSDRPAIVFHPVWQLPFESRGCKAEEKINKIRKVMEEEKVTAHLLTSLEDIAWILNLRGNDIPCNPVFLSYLYMTQDICILFADTEALKNFEAFDFSGVLLRPYEEIYEFLKTQSQEKIWIDKKVVNAALVELLSRGRNTFFVKPNPSAKLKAVKNETECRNIRRAHVLDGVAVTKFLYFLKQYRNAVLEGLWQEPFLTEIQLGEILHKYRKQQEDFIEDSFEPIMAYGPNGAIVHYSAKKDTNREIKPDSFLLSDTGGHYLWGTTDITRTISMATKEDLTEEQKRHYTLVLKAHLNLLGAKFPKGVTGNSLDAIARQPLWQEGLDFNHGTGHGVGYILSVHEGPNGIRTYRGKGAADLTPMEPGMITSNEPGLYLEGQYGIRLESLMECVQEENGFYGFRSLTCVPFDRDAIDVRLLNNYEKNILDSYHRQVYDKINKRLSIEERNWLLEETQPIQ